MSRVLVVASLPSGPLGLRLRPRTVPGAASAGRAMAQKNALRGGARLRVLSWLCSLGVAARDLRCHLPVCGGANADWFSG